MDHVLFQKSVFYDSKFVTSSARTAHQPPRGALIAKEVAEKMLAFADLSEQIKARKVKVSQNVISKKNVFDHKWSEKYSDESEFWTFEFIIQTFKVFIFTSTSFLRKYLILRLNFRMSVKS